MLNLHDTWGLHTTDLFADNLHLNPAGAAVLVGEFNASFLGL